MAVSSADLQIKPFVGNEAVVVSSGRRPGEPKWNAGAIVRHAGAGATYYTAKVWIAENEESSLKHFAQEHFVSLDAAKDFIAEVFDSEKLSEIPGTRG